MLDSRGDEFALLVELLDLLLGLLDVMFHLGDRGKILVALVLVVGKCGIAGGF